jgi:MerR family transcriptional regulator, light-induced transcriptional regulator
MRTPTARGQCGAVIRRPRLGAAAAKGCAAMTAQLGQPEVSGGARLCPSCGAEIPRVGCYCPACRHGLDRRDRVARQRAIASPRTQRAAQRLARALENFNPQGTHNALDEIFASLTIDDALSEVVLPYLRSLEASRLPGPRAIAHIQFATGLLEARLRELGHGWESIGNQTAVVAYPGAERDTFDGLAFSLALHDRGWRIVFLGPHTPVDEALRAARRAEAEVIILASSDPATFADLQLSGWKPDPEHVLVLGGRGANPQAAKDLGGELLPRHPVVAAQELHRRHATRVERS